MTPQTHTTNRIDATLNLLLQIGLFVAFSSLLKSSASIFPKMALQEILIAETRVAHFIGALLTIVRAKYYIDFAASSCNCYCVWPTKGRVALLTRALPTILRAKYFVDFATSSLDCRSLTVCSSVSIPLVHIIEV